MRKKLARRLRLLARRLDPLPERAWTQMDATTSYTIGGETPYWALPTQRETYEEKP